MRDLVVEVVGPCLKVLQLHPVCGHKLADLLQNTTHTLHLPSAILHSAMVNPGRMRFDKCLYAFAKDEQTAAPAKKARGHQQGMHTEWQCLTDRAFTGAHLIQNIRAVPVAGRPSLAPQPQQLQQ